MKQISYIFISVAVSLTCVLLAYLFVPLSTWDTLDKIVHPPKFGSTITTILGSDTISGSRTTINTNFANLNSGKFELSDWYATTSAAQLTSLANLTTIGPITSGIWNGTAIGVAYNGTGTTSPTLNQIMFGNASSGFKVIGFGTTGQVLTSAGVSLIPTWGNAAIDTTANYNWTGNSLFQNFLASSTAANPITLNGLTFSTPSIRASSSTVLEEDGSGHLTFEVPDVRVLDINSNSNTVQSTATTTVYTFLIPAGTLGPSTRRMEFEVNAVSTNSAVSGNCQIGVDVGTGAASTTIGFANAGASTAGSGQLSGVLIATSSATGYAYTRSSTSPAGIAVQNTVVTGNFHLALNFAATTYLAFRLASENGTSAVCKITNEMVTLYRTL